MYGLPHVAKCQSSKSLAILDDGINRLVDAHNIPKCKV